MCLDADTISKCILYLYLFTVSVSKQYLAHHCNCQAVIEAFHSFNQFHALIIYDITGKLINYFISEVMIEFSRRPGLGSAFGTMIWAVSLIVVHDGGTNNSTITAQAFFDCRETIFNSSLK